jgi:hypothetical protein
MALKFQCKSCGEDIAVRFLKVGEAAKCKSCKASNAVPESAEIIDDEVAKSMIKAPVSESVEDISVEAISAESVQSVPIAKALRRVGRIVIGFGVIAGIAGAVRVMIRHPAPDQTIALAVSVGITGLGIMFFFCILGVICLGIAKVIELLTK